jgi:hypothetical protein
VRVVRQVVEDDHRATALDHARDEIFHFMFPLGEAKNQEQSSLRFPWARVALYLARVEFGKGRNRSRKVK